MWTGLKIKKLIAIQISPFFACETVYFRARDASNIPRLDLMNNTSRCISSQSGADYLIQEICVAMATCSTSYMYVDFGISRDRPD